MESRFSPDAIKDDSLSHTKVSQGRSSSTGIIKRYKYTAYSFCTVHTFMGGGQKRVLREMRGAEGRGRHPTVNAKNSDAPPKRKKQVAASRAYGTTEAFCSPYLLGHILLIWFTSVGRTTTYTQILTH